MISGSRRSREEHTTVRMTEAQPLEPLAAVDTVVADLLKAHLAVDAASVVAAFGRASRQSETVDGVRSHLESLDATFHAFGLDALAALDPRAAAEQACRALGTFEMRDVYAVQAHLTKRQRAAELSREHARHLDATTLGRAIGEGRLPIASDLAYRGRLADIVGAHPALATPAGCFEALRATLAARHTSPVPGAGDPFSLWLSIRLVEDPCTESADVLREALASRSLALASDLVGSLGVAIGDRALLELAASRVGTPDEDGGALMSLFALDPSEAFDRLGARLALGATGQRALLAVLAQDGFRTHALTGYPSSRPQGFVRADARWIEPLMALRAHDDPNLSEPAKRALGHADLAKVLALLPTPKKKIPALSLELLGEIFVTGSPRVWVGAGRIVIASAPGSLVSRRLDRDLPSIAEHALPAGLFVRASEPGGLAERWSTPGLHDLVIRADGALVIAGETASGEHVLARSKGDGSLASTVRFEEAVHTLTSGSGGKGLVFAAALRGGQHAVLALDPASLEIRGEVSMKTDFPDPVSVRAVTHPREDVGVFVFECGQDGAWLKVVGGAPKLSVQKHKLTAKQPSVELSLVSPDGATAIFARGQTLTLRPWPALEAPKKKRVDASVVACGGAADAIAVAIAEVSEAPSAIELRRFVDGERVAKGRHPLGETLVVIDDGVLVTRLGDVLRVHRLVAP